MTRIEERLRSRMQALRAAVLEADGDAESTLRKAAFDGTPRDPRVARFVEKVRHASYKVDASDVDTLLAAGLGEGAIFEVTLAAALGEGLRRLRIGLSLLGGAR